MKPKRHKDSEDLLEILKAYRLPTIIMSIGMIIAIFGFQLALSYNMNQSEQSFREISEQVYRTVDIEVRRHEQLAGSIARILGQIKGLTKEEFSDISTTFADTTYFTHFYLYTFNQGEGIIKLSKESFSTAGGSVTEFFSSADAEEKIKNMSGLPEIRMAVEKANTLDKTYLSNPYKLPDADNLSNFVVVATPIPERHRKNLFLVGVLDLDKLFANTLQTENEEINARVYNIVNLEKNLIYEHIEPDGKEFFSVENEKYQNTLSFRRTHFFDDHEWEIIIFSSLHRLISYVGLLPWITFLSILAVAGMLSHIIFRITTESLKATAMVERQTKSLREYAEKLEMSNRDLDDFAHIASHDLKEPLRGIYNYAEFLREDYSDKLDEQGRSKLDTLKTLSRRMESLVESLLEYSKLTRIDMAFRKADLNEILQSVLETMEIWLEENGGRVSVKDPLPAIVCDPIRVAEVFRNLITNAVKYNKNPIRTVEVGYIPDYEGWNGIPVFYVRDNGIGIAEEHKQHIFKIFRRLHGRDEYGGGTGAGLTIIWKIIERHGGKIWLKSKPNEGTTFFFTLMRKTDAVA